MRNEKGLPARSPKENQHQETTKPAEFVNPSVTFYPQGVMLHKPVRGVKPKESGGRRGTISGWSTASRRRMREWMLTHQAPSGYHTHGVTFTIPGPLLGLHDAKELWKDCCRRVERAGWGMVWRIEIQSRGAHHWHAILILPKGDPEYIGNIWNDCLRKLPPVEHVVANTSYYGLRTALPGAALHACNVDCGGDRGSWLRYMQDHASKGKQEQIPEDIGRHWGVVGRKVFVERDSSLKAELSDKGYARVVRWMRRLATPIRPNPASVFGKSLSYSPRRGMWGHSVWYSDPITVARFVKQARSLDLAALVAWEEYRQGK